MQNTDRLKVPGAQAGNFSTGSGSPKRCTPPGLNRGEPGKCQDRSVPVLRGLDVNNGNPNPWLTSPLVICFSRLLKPLPRTGYDPCQFLLRTRQITTNTTNTTNKTGERAGPSFDRKQALRFRCALAVHAAIHRYLAKRQFLPKECYQP